MLILLAVGIDHSVSYYILKRPELVFWLLLIYKLSIALLSLSSWLDTAKAALKTNIKDE